MPSGRLQGRPEGHLQAQPDGLHLGRREVHIGRAFRTRRADHGEALLLERGLAPPAAQELEERFGIGVLAVAWSARPDRRSAGALSAGKVPTIFTLGSAAASVS